MQSLKENPKLTKVLVDNYELRGDRLLCNCLIAEPFETFKREVTYEEIYNHVVINGKVVMESGEQITFTDYFSELGIQDTCDLCAEIINKRENRIEISDMPDIFSTLGAILNPNQSPMRTYRLYDTVNKGYIGTYETPDLADKIRTNLIHSVSAVFEIHLFVDNHFKQTL